MSWTIVRMIAPMGEDVCADIITALKNADSFLRDVMKAVDTNGDGNIQYSGT